MEEDKDGIINGSFVRKDFYLPPPDKNAAPEVWAAWLEADKKAAAQAKRAHTMSLKHEEVPEFLQPKVLTKIGGVYRQSVMVGLVGSAEEGTMHVEAAIDADQTKNIATAGFTHGGRGSAGSQRASGAQRRKAKKAARRALRLVKH